MFDLQSVGWHLQVPGCLDQPPARLHLQVEVRFKGYFLEPVDLVGQDNSAAVAGALLDEKRIRYGYAVDDVESIEHIIEAQSRGRADQLVMADLALIVLAAGCKETAAAAGPLLVRLLQMLTDVFRKWPRELLGRQVRFVLIGQIKQRLCQGKFIGGDVAAKQDDQSPIGFVIGAGFLKNLDRSHGQLDTSLGSNCPAGLGLVLQTMGHIGLSFSFQFPDG